MAKQGSQEWKDNISRAKREKHEKLKEDATSVDQYQNEVMSRVSQKEGRRIPIDFDTIVDDSMKVIRPFSSPYEPYEEIE